MTARLDIGALRSSVLTMRRSWPDCQNDYCIIAASVTFGRIMLMPKSHNIFVWFWTVTGPYLPPHLNPGNGDADTIESAKAAFQKKLSLWFEWAVTQKSAHIWNGHQLPHFLFT